ncbi:MAG TPA: chloride channel protein [Tepidisphaeraceae bacterium]|nr:chloride channel protein [Tepidisphaeraceae bacterium]
MYAVISGIALRMRLLMQRLLVTLGFRDDSFLVIVAVVIGIIASAAAVGFHELIALFRGRMFSDYGSSLYGTHLWLLILWPTLGGLAVGVLGHYVFRAREGHGVIDVIESVVRSSGFVKPGSAIEKILTSAITIGTGGSAGAEGPIVQIGAAISSGVGSIFALTRQHMPVVVGCGVAAGISSIFNAPIGGLLFTLEVILQDFSIRTLTPLVVASVVANVTTQAIYRALHHWTEHAGGYDSIFFIPPWVREAHADVLWPQLAAFAILGVSCGLLAIWLTKSMFASERWFGRRRWPRAIRPAVGGAMLGAMGVAYVLAYQFMTADAGEKPIPLSNYALPAFFSDGYGAIQSMLGPEFYTLRGPAFVAGLLAVLVVLKVLGTCVTLSSGGSGGIIAPSLFIGAAGGGLMGLALQATGVFDGIRPELYALLGMAGVLAAVVHAPLASILILMEITGDSTLVLPAMLTAVVATSIARLILPDSIYTHALRERGVPIGTGTDLLLLRRLSIEQVELQPANVVSANEPIERVLTAVAGGTDGHFVAIDAAGDYAGMICDDDLRAALVDRDAVPLLLVRDVMRSDVRPVSTTDDLATVMDRFTQANVDCLPVCVAKRSKKIIGILSRAALMRRYRQAIAEQG